MFLREAEGPQERRRRILDALVAGAVSEEPNGSGPFFPVFEATEAAGSPEAIMRELRARYPQLMGGAWFVDDRQRGILGPSGDR